MQAGVGDTVLVMDEGTGARQVLGLERISVKPAMPLRLTGCDVIRTSRGKPREGSRPPAKPPSVPAPLLSQMSDRSRRRAPGARGPRPLQATLRRLPGLPPSPPAPAARERKSLFVCRRPGTATSGARRLLAGSGRPRSAPWWRRFVRLRAAKARVVEDTPGCRRSGHERDHAHALAATALKLLEHLQRR